MNFNWVKCTLAGIALVISAGSTASVITDPMDIDTYVSAGHSKSWTHDITDDGFTLGSAVSGILSIEFSDDASDPWYAPFELATIVLNVVDFQDGAMLYVPTSDWSGGLGINSLISLNSTGMLNVKVWSDLGDFYIGKSTLEVVTTSVPEPGSMVLFGLGLLGLGFLRRVKAS